MCRLFGMSGGPRAVQATFWLLDAPHSLATQSRREPDGTGLGHFADSGRPCLDKQPIAAYEDRAFAEEARTVRSRTFVAHVRFGYAGGVATRNTQPFEQGGRLLAHQGLVEELPKLDERLGADRALVQGDTDSERVLALITKLADQNGGAVDRAIADAATWMARNLPLYALNIVLITQEELWALRYPDSDHLYVLEREPGGPHGDRHADHASASGRIRVRSHDLRETAAVVVASERMDEDPGWRLLEPGEMVHVDGSLRVTTHQAVDGPPERRIRLEDLGERAIAAAQPGP
jgi:predicted glutamine amidotransferase